MAIPECYAMPKISVEWVAGKTVTSIRKGEKAFLIHAKVAGKAVTFMVTFPAIGGVRITESKGFFVCEENLPITYSGKKTLKLSAGNTSVLFNKDAEKGFRLDVLNADGKTVMSLDGNSILFGLAGNKIQKIKKTMLNIGFKKDEVLYGLGERFNTFNQVGHDALMWNMDTDTFRNYEHLNESYQCIPILHSTAGYMLYVNSMYGGWFDFGKKTPYVYSWDFNGPTVDLFVFTGTPKENLKSYADLTGHTIIPPKWVFQYWMGGGAPQWKNPEDKNDPEYYQKTLRAYIDGYKEMGIPHIAACYGEGGPSKNKTGYDIAAESGMRMLIWNHPSVDASFSMEVLGTEDRKELPQITDKHLKPIQSWVDFTKPNTKTAVSALYKKYFDWGLKGAMIDFGEYVTPDALMHNGKDGNAMHNEHSYWYAKVMKEVFEERHGDDYVLFQRSGCAGSQGFVCQFGGDQLSRFCGLKQAFYAGLNVGASGFNIWGSDIGGYWGSPTPELYMRWLEFATFSPLMRSHGVGTERNPWAYGEAATELFKKLFWWRENMLDYLYGTAIHAHHTAEPIIRVMAIEFPNEGMDAVDTQYMFGSELLVAPVIEEAGHKRIVFPKGKWVNLWNGEVYEGDRELLVTVKTDDVAVFLRAGAAMKLNVAPSLNICESMADGISVPVLMVTPAETKREVKHWIDADTCVAFVTDKVADEAVTVENPNGIALEAVIVNGYKATKVLVDGKETAFTVENNKTVVKTPCSFKTVQVF